MNRLTSFAALATAALIGSLSASAWSNERASSWSDEVISYGTAAPADKAPATAPAPAPASTAVPGQYAPPVQGGYAQPWQQPHQWRAPQQGYGQFPRYYPQGGQYPAYPAAPATAATTRKNPLSAELKQTQEQLTAKSSELGEAYRRIDELDGKLQDSLAAAEKLSDKMAYNTREQQALRVRVTELNTALNTAKATLEQQHQLINNHQAQNAQLATERDQLHGELAGRDEQLAALQSELQAATQALAEANSKADSASEALSAARAQIGTHRDALTELAAELERLKARLLGDPQAPTE
ncbi:MAG: hypothetical protein HKP57_05880 [Halobacteria archaeon]|nr:hypothetical protein [Halobacteria archaeon]